MKNGHANEEQILNELLTLSHNLICWMREIRKMKENEGNQNGFFLQII